MSYIISIFLQCLQIRKHYFKTFFITTIICKEKFNSPGRGHKRRCHIEEYAQNFFGNMFMSTCICFWHKDIFENLNLLNIYRTKIPIRRRPQWIQFWKVNYLPKHITKKLIITRLQFLVTKYQKNYENALKKSQHPLQ